MKAGTQGPEAKGGAVPELSGEMVVRYISLGSLGLVALLALLIFVAALSARNGGETMERSAAFVLALFAALIGFTAFWVAHGGLESMGGVVRQVSQSAGGVLTSLGLPPSVLNVQASLVSVLVAGMAWRFAVRKPESD